MGQAGQQPFRCLADDRVRLLGGSGKIADLRLELRSLLNGRYHETRLTRYWRRFVLKDWLLAALVHPLEERFDPSDPLYVMLALEKQPAEQAVLHDA